GVFGPLRGVSRALGAVARLTVSRVLACVRCSLILICPLAVSRFLTGQGAVVSRVSSVSLITHDPPPGEFRMCRGPAPQARSDGTHEPWEGCTGRRVRTYNNVTARTGDWFGAWPWNLALEHIRPCGPRAAGMVSVTLVPVIPAAPLGPRRRAG